MMRSADEVIVLADHGKLDRTALAHLCPLSDISTLIVDPQLSPEQEAWLAKAGVRLVKTPPLQGQEGGAA